MAKIKAKYLGKEQKIQEKTLDAMKRVFKLYIGKPDILAQSTKHECLFQIEGHNIWLPIQEILIKSLKKEYQKGEEMLLYCLFLNEHLTNGELRNIFFVSEFRIE